MQKKNEKKRRRIKISREPGGKITCVMEEKK